MPDLTPSIEVFEGKPVVSSLKVAEHFGKQHKHILRLIDQKIAMNGTGGQPKIGPSPKYHADFFASNFFPATYQNEQNKTHPMFYMTRNGFSYLVMGFTGEKADDFKILYINAFTRIEVELLKSLEQKAEQGSIRNFTPDFSVRVHRGFVPISAEQMQGLMGLVTFWAELEQLPVEEAWQRVLDKMGIPSWEYIQGQEFDQLVWDIQRMMYRASREMQVMPTNEHDMTVINGLLDYGVAAKGYKRNNMVELVCAMCGVPNLDNLSPLGAGKVKMALWCGLAELKMVGKEHGK